VRVALTFDTEHPARTCTGRVLELILASLADADIVGRPSSLYYAQVQALKFLQTKATPAAARRAARRRQIRRATSGRNR